MRGKEEGRGGEGRERASLSPKQILEEAVSDASFHYQSDDLIHSDAARGERHRGSGEGRDTRGSG